MKRYTLASAPDYFITKKQEVYSKERFIITGTGRRKYNLKKIAIVKNKKTGYLQVFLTVNKVRKYFLLHRLMAITFVPNQYNLPEVNHKNTNKEDNRPINLEWCDRLYNANHAKENGLYVGSTGESNGRHKLTNKEVLDIFNSSDSFKEIASKYNVHRVTINRIKIGKKWGSITGKKYTLRYKTSY